MHFRNFSPKSKDIESPEDEYDNLITPLKNNLSFKEPTMRDSTHISRRGISFHVGRIVPKRIIHDKESLYEENIKLKGDLRNSESELIRLKTRLTASEKEKIRMADQLLLCEEIPTNKSSQRYMKRNTVAISTLHKQINMKKILRESEDELTKIKNENTNFKKSVKFTQLEELKVQNITLELECTRLRSIALQYETTIKELREFICQESWKADQLVCESKKKDEEKTMKTEKEVEVLKVLTKKGKFNVRGFGKNSISSSSKNPENALLEIVKESECQTCESLFKEIKEFEKIIKDLSDEIDILRGSHERAQESVSQSQVKIIMSQTSPDLPVETEELSLNNTQILVEVPKEKMMDEIEEEFVSENYGDDFEGEERERIEKEALKNEEEVHLNVRSSHKSEIKEIRSRKETIEEPECVKQQNNTPSNSYQHQSNVEILEKQVQITEAQKPTTNSNQEDEKCSESFFEEFNFEDVLIETISLRLMRQRYTYNDLSKDIKESELKEFTMGQLSRMLNDEPFFLADEELEYIFIYVFQQSELDPQMKVPVDEFLFKIQHFMPDFKLLAESEEKRLLLECREQVRSNLQQISNKMEKKSINGIINKANFTAVLKEFNFEEEKIKILIGEAAMISVLVERIDFEAFLQKICLKTE